MGLKLVKVQNYQVGILLYRDWVVELCLYVWFGSMLLGNYLEWEKEPWYMYIVDIILIDILYNRFNKMLPRRCWRSVVYYALYCAAAFVIGYTIVYFTRPDYFNAPGEVVKVLIIISIFLSVAAFGGYMWRRRVVLGAEILHRRTSRAKRRLN